MKFNLNTLQYGSQFIQFEKGITTTQLQWNFCALQQQMLQRLLPETLEDWYDTESPIFDALSTLPPTETSMQTPRIILISLEANVPSAPRHRLDVADLARQFFWRYSRTPHRSREDTTTPFSNSNQPFKNGHKQERGSYHNCYQVAVQICCSASSGRADAKVVSLVHHSWRSTGDYHQKLVFWCQGRLNWERTRKCIPRTPTLQWATLNPGEDYVSKYNLINMKAPEASEREAGETPPAHVTSLGSPRNDSARATPVWKSTPHCTSQRTSPSHDEVKEFQSPSHAPSNQNAKQNTGDSSDHVRRQVMRQILGNGCSWKRSTSVNKHFS